MLHSKYLDALPDDSRFLNAPQDDVKIFEAVTYKLNDTLLGSCQSNSRKYDTLKVKKLYSYNLKSHSSYGLVTFKVVLVQFFSP